MEMERSSPVDTEVVAAEWTELFNLEMLVSNQKHLIEIESQFTSGVYAKREVCFVRGEGTKIWDADGKEYLDFGVGISVANLGHAHPEIVNAISRQAATLMTAAELGYNDQRAILLKHLADITPASIDRFFLCNSGSEAIEGCIKFAHVATGRKKYVAAMRGFHGRTIGALAATHNKKYREPFSGLCPQFAHVPFNNLAKIESAIDDQTAGVIIEMVQGEGGVRMADEKFVKAVQKLCVERGAKLIVDEVQTGFGRTGTMFACEHFGVEPDLLAMGKAIAAGVPMGAVGIGKSIDGIKPGLHGSTFGGNPLACAAAIAHLGVLQETKLVQHAREMGAYFLEQLRGIKSTHIREIRGVGLMIGVELKTRVGPILRELLEQGFMVLNAGPTVVRFLPPLNVSRSEVDAVVAALKSVLTGVPELETSE